MRYRALDSDYDMQFGHQQGDFARDVPQAVAQAIRTRLLLWTGEWFLDSEEGTPWVNGVLGYGTRETAEPALRSVIRETQGVVEINSLSATFDADSRKLTVSGVVTTAYGEIQLNEVL